MQIKDYIGLVIPQLLVLINLQSEKKSYAAIILGRLGLFCYNQIGPFYNQFSNNGNGGLLVLLQSYCNVFFFNDRCAL